MGACRQLFHTRGGESRTPEATERPLRRARFLRRPARVPALAGTRGSLVFVLLGRARKRYLHLTAPGRRAPARSAVEDGRESVAPRPRGARDDAEQRRPPGLEALRLVRPEVGVATDHVVAVDEPAHHATGESGSRPPLSPLSPAAGRGWQAQGLAAVPTPGMRRRTRRARIRRREPAASEPSPGPRRNRCGSEALDRAR